MGIMSAGRRHSIQQNIIPQKMIPHSQSSTLHRQHLTDFRLAALHKSLLFRQHSKNCRPLARLATSPLQSRSNQFSPQAPTMLQNGDRGWRGREGSRKGEVVGNGSLEKAKVSRRKIDWSMLREELHRPRFDRWQSKMVSRMVQSGHYQKLVQLLK